jgi:hypothetical protein
VEKDKTDLDVNGIVVLAEKVLDLNNNNSRKQIRLAHRASEEKERTSFESTSGRFCTIRLMLRRATY